MWALAITTIVVIAFAIAMIILYVLARDQQSKAVARAVTAENALKTTSGAVKGLEAEVARQKAAREAQRTHIKELEGLVVTCSDPKALPGLLTNFFTKAKAGDAEPETADVQPGA